jgi:hypothetical protein
VATRVRPDQVEVVTVTVVQTVALLMNDPRFLNELEVIRLLNERVVYLTNQNLLLKETLTQLGGVRAPRKKAATRKAPAKRRAPQVKGGTPAQRNAFRQGYQS